MEGISVKYFLKNNFILDSSSGQPLHNCESKRYAIFTACSSNQDFLHHEQAKSSIDWFYFTFEIIIILIIVFIVHFPVLTLQHLFSVMLFKVFAH